MKLLKSIKCYINKKRLVTQKHTTVSGNVWKYNIKKPNIDKLYNCGFTNENRGYRMKTKKQLSLHVLPTSQGWEVHVDRSSYGKHTLSKAKYTKHHLNKFFKRYPIV